MTLEDFLFLCGYFQVSVQHECAAVMLCKVEDSWWNPGWGVSSLDAPKPSRKIESVNRAFLFWYWQWLKKYFFRNKTLLFFKIESWNFQNPFEKEFRETSKSFNSIRQPIEKVKITIVWMRWVSWKLWGFMKFYIKQILKVSAFYLEKQKSRSL